MEKQYKQLTSSEISVGRKFVQDVLTNAAKQTATNYASKYMTKGIDAVIKKATKQVGDSIMALSNTAVPKYYGMFRDANNRERYRFVKKSLWR